MPNIEATLVRLLAATSFMLAWLVGCAPGSLEDQGARTTSRLTADASAATNSTETLHDFGLVVGKGQVLRREFNLRNPSDKPLHVLGAAALSPCCSRIGTPSKLVPPAGEIRIPVELNLGSLSGKRYAQFLVRTDDDANPNRLFTLTATLLAEIELEVLAGSNSTLRMGQTGRQRLRVTCRQRGNHGRSAPESVEVVGALSARFAEGADVVRQRADLVEIAREIEVLLAADRIGGPKTAALVFRWPDGTAREEIARWQVEPCVEVSPGALVLPGSGDPFLRSIRLRSADRPFRILSVKGSVLESCAVPPDADTEHTLQMSLASTRPSGLEATDLVIETDHSVQPTVLVSILVVPEKQLDESTPLGEIDVK